MDEIGATVMKCIFQDVWSFIKWFMIICYAIVFLFMCFSNMLSYLLCFNALYSLLNSKRDIGTINNCIIIIDCYRLSMLVYFIKSYNWTKWVMMTYYLIGQFLFANDSSKLKSKSRTKRLCDNHACLLLTFPTSK